VETETKATESKRLSKSQCNFKAKGLYSPKCLHSMKKPSRNEHINLAKCKGESLHPVYNIAGIELKADSIREKL
jgi:hypothetical protein